MVPTTSVLTTPTQPLLSTHLCLLQTLSATPYTQVFHYSMDMFRLGLEAAKTRSGPGGAAFRAGLAAAAARAAGAR